MSIIITELESLQIAFYEFCSNCFESSIGKEDIVFSAYSMFIAFALLYIGAASETKSQLEKVFGFSAIPQINFIDFMKSMMKYGDNSTVTVDIANGIWADETFKFKEEYQKAIEELDCKLKNVNFVEPSEGIRKEINEWVEDITHNIIKDFIKEGTITGDTVNVIVNAIYFKGDWKNPFEILQNKMKFKGNQEVVGMIVELESSALFNEDYSSVRIPYNDDKHSMIIIMPQNMEEFEKQKRTNEFKQITKQTINQFEEKRKVSIPKFSIETSFDMNEQLSKLGLTDAFNSKADFSKKTDDNIFISNAIHKAVVKVDEKGTVGAAATVIIMANSLSIQPHLINVTTDKPFYFVIVEDNNNLPLFYGKITNLKLKFEFNFQKKVNEKLKKN